MNVKYKDHLPIEFKAAAARIYMEALKSELSPVLGDAERAMQFLARTLSPEYCLTAFCDGKLVGVLGVQTAEGGFWSPGLKSLVEEYGAIGGLYRLCGLYLLHHQVEPGEWCADGVAVAGEMRGKGVGTGLFGILEKTAAAKGCREISLEVTDVNQRAKALYERLGFIETARESLWPLNLFFKFPFQSSTLMVKPVSNQGGARGVRPLAV
ncbi:MAG: GNAT family N-acetyltransferase [Desulfobacterales bacterium]|nr:GNAT family N-acetyltransferase [Desulfobacterales bacterium]